MTPDTRVVTALHEARRAEKEQALFYHALAAAAEHAGDTEAAEALNGLLADEQHHLSRLTVQLVEANEALDGLDSVAAPPTRYPDWQAHARAREEAEIARYERLSTLPVNDALAALLREILAVERQHAARLGGKYMNA
jgi:rubrerythrin